MMRQMKYIASCMVLIICLSACGGRNESKAELIEDIEQVEEQKDIEQKDIEQKDIEQKDIERSEEHTSELQ